MKIDFVYMIPSYIDSLTLVDAAYLEINPRLLYSHRFVSQNANTVKYLSRKGKFNVAVRLYSDGNLPDAIGELRSYPGWDNIWGILVEASPTPTINRLRECGMLQPNIPILAITAGTALQNTNPDKPFNALAPWLVNARVHRDPYFFDRRLQSHQYDDYINSSSYAEIVVGTEHNSRQWDAVPMGVLPL